MFRVSNKYKFFFGFILILFLGFGVYYGVRFYRYRTDLKSLADVNAYLDQFKNDNIGGKTPEETLKMFVAALKKEDTELASQYFALDDNGSRQKWLDYLNGVKTKGLLATMASDIENEARPAKSDDIREFYYKLYNSDGTVGITIYLVKNANVWKIVGI